MDPLHSRGDTLSTGLSTRPHVGPAGAHGSAQKTSSLTGGCPVTPFTASV